MMTLAGLAVAGLIALVAFVAPNWSDYRFYNWYMPVVRKPDAGLSMLDRASWLPIVHDFFTRMWLLTVLGLGAAFGVLARWRRAVPAERLLLAWLALGVAELVVHDVGKERYLLFLVPPLAALAALALARDRQLLSDAIAGLPRRRAVLFAPFAAFAIYILAGAVLRLGFLYEVRPGVRLSAAVAFVLTAVLFLTWPALPRWSARPIWSMRTALVLASLIVVADLAQFAQWAAGRTYKNHEASRAIGRLLPPGTLVHGKLANGLALENGIRPVFVGRGFGNYDDRTSRDDVRYLLTYIAPSLGFEGPVIRDVLTVYPNWRIVKTFEVAETAGGHDVAALIDKGVRDASGVRGGGARARR